LLNFAFAAYILALTYLDYRVSQRHLSEDLSREMNPLVVALAKRLGVRAGLAIGVGATSLVLLAIASLLGTPGLAFLAGVKTALPVLQLAVLAHRGK
jgi:hypothetical protein